MWDKVWWANPYRAGKPVAPWRYPWLRRPPYGWRWPPYYWKGYTAARGGKPLWW